MLIVCETTLFIIDDGGVSMSAFQIVLMILLPVVGLAAGFFCGFLYRKNVSEKVIGSAEAKARDIVNDAIKTAETRNSQNPYRSGKRTARTEK